MAEAFNDLTLPDDKAARYATVAQEIAAVLEVPPDLTPVPAEQDWRTSAPPRARGERTHRGWPQKFVWVGCCEKRHDEHAQTESNTEADEQGNAEDVFHSRSLRSCAVRVLRG